MKLNLKDPYTDFVKAKLSQEKKICELSDGIIALTFQAIKYLKEDYNITPNKIFLIRNGIKVNYDDFLDRNFRKDKNEFHFLFVGRISEEKGVSFLLKAFDDLANDIPNIKLFLAGSGEVPSLKLKNDSKIKFLGHLSKKELNLLYSQSDVGLIPSFNEECSYVALEMMNNKIPIICSNLSGFNEMFTHGLNALKVGFYYDKKHITKLSIKDIKCMMKELHKNKGLRCDLKENAFLNLCENYSIESMIGKTSELYNEV